MIFVSVIWSVTLSYWPSVVTTGNLLEVHWIYFSCLVFCWQQWNPMRSRRNWGWRGYVIAIGTSSRHVRRRATAYMRDLRGLRPITSYEPTSVGLPPAIRMLSQDTRMLWYSAFWWQACEVKWSGSVVVPNMITSLLRGRTRIATSVNDTKCSLTSVVKFFLKFAWICSNKLMEEDRDGARQESLEIKFED